MDQQKPPKALKTSSNLGASALEPAHSSTTLPGFYRPTLAPRILMEQRRLALTSIQESLLAYSYIGVKLLDRHAVHQVVALPPAVPAHAPAHAAPLARAPLLPLGYWALLVRFWVLLYRGFAIVNIGSYFFTDYIKFEVIEV